MPGTAHDSGIESTEHSAPIPHSRPLLSSREEQAVAAVVQSAHLAQGERVAALEAACAASVDVVPAGAAAGDHGAAVSSGTAALYLALRGLGIGDGDDVLIPAFVCTSLHAAVVLTGATATFVDCDPVSLNPDPDDARKNASSRTAACIVPHLFGLPADIDAFVAMGIPVIEDCAQTLGVSVDGHPVGGTGAATVCSFYATKLVAGGEGGMVLSDDRAMIERIRDLRDCEAPGDAEGAFNFKMSDLHAAIAEIQLDRLEESLQRRALLADAYRRALTRVSVDLPRAPSDRGHAWFRFVVALRDNDVEDVIIRGERHGVCCRRPVGKLARGVDLDSLSGCRSAWERSCSLPLYPALSDADAGAVPRRFSAALEHEDE